MAKVYEFLANGFEEIEALAPVDILRRGGVEVHTVSVTGSEFVESSHGVTIKADMLFTRPEDYRDADLLMIPGGMPGSTNLNAHEGVRQAMLWQYNSGKRVAAICAAPMVLGGIGILNGKKATCSPGFQKYLTGATYTAELYQEPAATLPYAYRILSYFVGEEKARELQKKMQYAHLMEAK